jgi:hypothetical protein
LKVGDDTQKKREMQGFFFPLEFGMENRTEVGLWLAEIFPEASPRKEDAMSVSSAKTPALPEKWAKVLGKVEKMLEETVDSATRRQETLQGLLGNDEESHRRSQEIFQMRDSFQGLDKLLQTAGVVTTEVDLALAGGEKMVRDYLADSEALRQRLATWAGGAIG